MLENGLKGFKILRYIELQVQSKENRLIDYIGVTDHFMLKEWKIIGIFGKIGKRRKNRKA